MEHLDKKSKITIMIAIMSAMLFAALNQTIVGTALPKIIADLGGMEYFSWVFTVFMLASSVTAILVGKLSDIYGRKPFILIGIGVFMIGTFLCGTSDTIIQLIGYRALQGFGAGMIMSTAFTAVGDLFSPRERGRWQGIMGSVFGLASVFGPTLGGYIVDNFDWHWIFWVFLPIGIIAFVLIWKLFPSVEHNPSEKVDYLGSIFLTLTILPLLLAFSWAGETYAWGSPQIIGLFIATLLSLVIFIQVERKAASPVLPLHLFKNSIFSLSNVIGFILGMGMFGAIMYTPFFIQGVMGTSATKSGFIMMPMTLSMVTASAIGGQIITKTGKYKKLAIIGLIIMSVGMLFLAQMDESTSNGIAVVNMIIVGLGLGLSFPVFTLTIQNAVSHKFLGVATSSAQLFRQIGGTIGVSVMGTIMSLNMKKEMTVAAEVKTSQAFTNPDVAEKFENLQDPQVLMDPEALDQMRSTMTADFHGMFDQLISMLRSALSHSLSEVFLTGSLVIASAVFLTLFLKEIPLRDSNAETVDNKEKSINPKERSVQSH
ncbi:MDR family MFS transporter [Pseudalkalibacillus salsuginis]|uniref:MDR family MFS transporter n=1 Tax=Pseudalkalibacillus salsuginis TaxID=2910972 RepID=UPI001F39B795|nr:MDR family MFS transporter [Pseudalkalibacillus salsuginis]MCF6409962.1 MFS transporter [Pseudalkalibacillus salsuginis]